MTHADESIIVTLTKDLRLAGLPTGRMTGDQWRRIRWPRCPKCGTTVEVDRIDDTRLSDPPYLNYYVCGRWQCPNECDPRETA